MGKSTLTSRHAIVTYQVLAYLSIIPMFYYGQWYHFLISFFFYFLYNGIGMIMTYHRLLSHRVFSCSKLLEYVMASIATFSISGSAITWVAMHRPVSYTHLTLPTNREV